MHVEGTDFGGAANLQRHHEAIAGYSRGDDPGALRQRCRDVGSNNASLGAEKTLADGDQDGRDR